MCRLLTESSDQFDFNLISSSVHRIYLEAIELSVMNHAVTIDLTCAHSYSSISPDLAAPSMSF